MLRTLYKNMMVLFLVGILGILAACGLGAEESGEEVSDTEESAEQNQEKLTLSLAHWMTGNTPVGRQYEKLAELVQERTEGAVEIEVFPGGQLGNQRDILEGVQAGTIDMSKADDAYLANYIPEYGLFSLPFIFKNFDHLEAVLDSEITAELDEQLLSETGLRSLGWTYIGFRHFYLANEVQTLDDFKGMNIRAPEVDVYIDTISHLGANPTPMPWGEVYTALETGVVEGVEGEPADALDMNFHEVVDYVLLTDHIQVSSTIVINDQKWQSIPKEYQEVIMDAIEETTILQREEQAQAAQDALQKMEEDGAIITRFENIEELRNAVMPVWEKTGQKLNAEHLIEKISNFE